MQMSNLYLSTNKKVRARQLRRDGAALRRAGFQDSAEQNFELAEMLDPTPRETDTVQPSHNQSKKHSEARKGESNGATTGQLPTHRGGRTVRPNGASMGALPQTPMGRNGATHPRNRRAA